MPYVVERVVKWGECDPAGIIYTPRAFDYATEAVEGWYRDVGGLDWQGMGQRNFGAPTVHAECDFLRPLRPNEKVRVVLGIERIGEASLTFRIDCLGGDGEPSLKVTMVSCFTDFAGGEARPMPIPPDIRARARIYRDAGLGYK